MHDYIEEMTFGHQQICPVIYNIYVGCSARALSNSAYNCELCYFLRSGHLFYEHPPALEFYFQHFSNAQELICDEISGHILKGTCCHPFVPEATKPIPACSLVHILHCPPLICFYSMRVPPNNNAFPQGCTNNEKSLKFSLRKIKHSNQSQLWIAGWCAIPTQNRIWAAVNCAS